jgi:hypothetical protein
MKCPQPFARHCLTLPGALSGACSGVIFAGLIGAIGLQPLSAQPPQTNAKSSASTPDETPSDGSDLVTSSTEQVGRTARTVGTRAISTITGEGTAGTIAKFTAPNQIGNSVIIESAGNIGIGTSTPGSKLTVSGAGASVIQGDNSSIAANAYGIHGRITSNAPGANAAGVRGTNNGTNGSGYGMFGSHAGSGSGVYGFGSNGNGVYGSSPNGRGVLGTHTATTGALPGVQGQTNSTVANASGVYGLLNSITPGADAAGVRGVNNGTNANGHGVFGSHAGSGSGVYGSSATGKGVYGLHSATSGSEPGVQGETNSTATGATGVRGIVSSSQAGNDSAGVRGLNQSTLSGGSGVYGAHAGGGSGVYGIANSGVGVSGNSNSYFGVFGDSNSGTGVHGNSTDGIGIRGIHSGATGSEPGVQGETNSGDDNASGVLGFIAALLPGAGSAAVRAANSGINANGYGVYATHDGGGFGVFGKSVSGVGIYGESDSSIGAHGLSNTNTGVFGLSNTGVGVHGQSDSNIGTYGLSNTNTGVFGFSTAGVGVHGKSEDGTAVLADGVNGIGLLARSTGSLAGRFEGNVTITGTLAKGAGTFKIDHPLDPANKYLSHSFVESPDMMNIYNGNVTLDKKGQAIVKMPDYFTALNREFRYQLTCIGGFAPVYVAQEIKSNLFKVAGGKPGMKVSWMVTGVRKDAYANANRVVAVEEKKGRERGAYLHPELFGQPKEKAIGYAQSPDASKAKPGKLAQRTTTQPVKK